VPLVITAVVSRVLLGTVLHGQSSGGRRGSAAGWWLVASNIPEVLRRSVFPQNSGHRLAAVAGRHLLGLYLNLHAKWLKSGRHGNIFADRHPTGYRVRFRDIGWRPRLL
jgi:hypothetical protein